MALALLAALVGCASIPHPTTADAARATAKWPAESLAGLEAGRARYVARCSSCHRLKAPAKHSADRWEVYLGKMGERARLTPEDEEAIRHYLVTLAERPPTP